MSGSNHKGVDKVKNGPKSRKLSSNNDSLSDLSVNSSRHDTSEDSLKIPRKDSSHQNEKKKPPRKKAPKKLKQLSDSDNSNSGYFFSPGDFEKAGKEKDALKKIEKTRLSTRSFSTKVSEIASALTEDHRGEESLKTTSGEF